MDRKEILATATNCICGDRDKKYGSPENSFGMIAALWDPFLNEKCVSEGAVVKILPEDVAAMMVLFKMARVQTAKHTIIIMLLQILIQRWLMIQIMILL